MTQRTSLKSGQSLLNGLPVVHCGPLWSPVVHFGPLWSSVAHLGGPFPEDLPPPRRSCPPSRPALWAQGVAPRGPRPENKFFKPGFLKGSFTASDVLINATILSSNSLVKHD